LAYLSCDEKWIGRIRGIDMKNLRTVDLNLLVAFEALMHERNVTRAADRIGLAQPSMSNALARLRAAFKDELFVATPKQMRPTRRALALAGPIVEALQKIRLALDPDRPFDPSTTARCFRLAGTNHANVTLITPIVEIMRCEAPLANLFIKAMTHRQTTHALEEGDIDLAIGVISELPRSVACRPLLTDRAVCLAQRGHLALTGGLTLRALIELPHVRAALSENPVEEVDVALAQKGLERRFAMVVPGYLAVAAVVANSTMIGIVPENLARPLAARAELAVHELPLELPSWTMSLLWSKRAENDPGLCWLRDRILATFAEPGSQRQVRSAGQAAVSTAKDRAFALVSTRKA
jgi:DNA-binding transcriptional LysR family regulator